MTKPALTLENQAGSGPIMECTVLSKYVSLWTVPLFKCYVPGAPNKVRTFPTPSQSNGWPTWG